MTLRKIYVALIDMFYKNVFWMTGETRKLTDIQALPLLNLDKIQKYEAKPKRFVIIINSDGS